MMQPFYIFLCSIVAGLIGSVLGIGGGLILVPLLTGVFGVNIEMAIGASIVTVIATSSGAAVAYIRDRLTNVRIGMVLEMATTTGALTGAILVGVLQPRILYIIFGAMTLYSAYAMLQRRNQELPVGVQPDAISKRLNLGGTYYDTALKKQVDYKVTGVVPGMAVMYGAGVLSGLLGIGSGAFKVLGMDLFMKVPMKVSSATSNFMMGVTAAASAGLYFARGSINPLIAAPVALGVLAGATTGARIMGRLKSATLRKLFIPVLAVVALQMLWKGLTIR